MTTNKDAPAADAMNKEFLRNLFYDIASTAGTAREAYREGSDDTPTTAAVLFEFINKIGWMADIGSGHLGGLQCNGSAEEWMLAPICLESNSEEEEAAA